MQTKMEFCASLSTSMRLAAAVSLIWIPLSMGASAQEPSQELDRPVASATVVPQQVRYAGKLAVRPGQTVQAEFRIYASQEGGEPLWSESQQFPIAADGSYSVLLGSANNAGLPQSVFAGGAARWLGVAVERAPEQERVLLSSVPYAMKSADAESLAGHAASDFVTQEQLAAFAVPVQTPQQPDAPAFTPLTVGAITGQGTGTATSGNLAVFNGANTIGNSDIVQVGNDIGINVASPASLLDVGGAATIRGTLDLPSTSTATTSAGFNSQSLELGSSAWSTTTAAPVAQNFFLENIATGNNTASPAAKLDLLFANGTGNPAATGFSIGSNGLLTFAPGQTFPGASTITTITTASPLTGGGSSGPLTLSLSLPTLETTLDSIYPQLATGNTFKASQSITGSLTTTVAVNTAALNTTTASIEGLTTAIGGINVGNNVLMHQINPATSTTPYNSPYFQFIGSAWNSTTAAAQNETFSWQTVVTGNNTASPSAFLQLLSGSGTSQSATGLTISPSGVINFVPSQTFPGGVGGGSGTITAVNPGTGLTGGGTSGSVTLAVNTAVVPELGLSNTFSGSQVFNGGITANSFVGSASITGNGTSGVAGLEGTSDSGDGVYGLTATGVGIYGIASGSGFGGYFFNDTTTSSTIYAQNAATGNPGLAVALKGVVLNADSIGVLGKATGNVSYGVFGEDVGGSDAYGVYASATGLGSDGLYATATGGLDANSNYGNGVVGVSTSGVGVIGTSHGNSNLGASFVRSAFGVWGDSGATSADGSIAGIAGTADDNYAAFFENHSNNLATIYADNAGTNLAAYLQNSSVTAPALLVINDGGNAAASFSNSSSTSPTLILNNNGTGGESVKRIFKTLVVSTSTGACGIGGDGDLSCTGQVKSLVSAGGGTRKVETYAMQSPENWMEDFGSSKLENGVVVVTIEPAFAETVTGDANYKVFLTANGDSEGLYVINKTATSFEVRESKGGTSSLNFDYRIVAKRRGYEAQRLTDVTEEFNQVQARVAESTKPQPKPMPERNAGTHHAVALGMPASMKAIAEAPERALPPTRPAAPKRADDKQSHASVTVRH